MKVSAADSKPLPAGSMVEISGQETACGSLTSNDARATVDDEGDVAGPAGVKIELVERPGLKPGE